MDVFFYLKPLISIAMLVYRSVVLFANVATNYQIHEPKGRQAM